MNARQVAIDHIIWAASHGMTPADVMSSIGLGHWSDPDWHDVQDALAIKWAALQRNEMKVAA